MKFEKYLADYIEQEIDKANENGLVVYYEEIIKQGFDAFESTENVEIEIKPKRLPESAWG